MHKQATFTHKVGTSDLSVHRALWELWGREPALARRRKVKAGQPTQSIK